MHILLNIISCVAPIVLLLILLSKINQNKKTVDDSLGALNTNIENLKRLFKKEGITDSNIHLNQTLKRIENQLFQIQEELTHRTPTTGASEPEHPLPTPEISTATESTTEETLAVVQEPVETKKAPSVIYKASTFDKILKEQEAVKETSNQDVQLPVCEEKKDTIEETKDAIEEPVAPQEPTIVPPKTTSPPKLQTELKRFFSENLLSKIGIVTLVLGIAYYVKYAIDENMISEAGRVAIGTLTGGLVIGLAHKIRKEYNSFSAILIGGGISILYVTITLAFREYHLIETPVAFALLTAVTVFSVLLSLFYNQKALAVFSLLGGFAAPLMISTNSGNYVALFSYLLILNTGMLILAQKKQWQIVSVIAYVLTQLFFWSWLNDKFVDEKAGALLFALLFFIQFYALALIEHFKSNRELTWFQATIILGSNLSLYAAAIYIFNDNPAYEGIITVALALLNAVPMFVLFKRKSVNKRFLYLLIAVVLTFVTLAVPMQLKGCVITLFWAAEALVMLWMWQKSKIRMFQMGYVVLELLVLTSLIIDWITLNNHFFVTGLFVSATLFGSQLLLKQENPTDSLMRVNMKLFQLPTWIRMIRILSLLTLYITPLLKIHANTLYRPNGTELLMGVYTYVFLAGFTLYKCIFKQNSKNLFLLQLALSLVFLFFLQNMNDVRFDTAITSQLSWNWLLFSVHFLYIPALATVWYSMFIYLKKHHLPKMTIFAWCIAAIATLFICVEIDNIGIMLFGRHVEVDYYFSLANKIHTVAYPIVWGIMAIGIMIWGLKSKELVLRRIALSLFALIIAKLYLIDIWSMNKSNKIIAFIALGIILLSASFIFQKIKRNIQNE